MVNAAAAETRKRNRTTGEPVAAHRGENVPTALLRERGTAGWSVSLAATETVDRNGPVRVHARRETGSHRTDRRNLMTTEPLTMLPCQVLGVGWPTEIWLPEHDSIGVEVAALWADIDAGLDPDESDESHDSPWGLVPFLLRDETIGAAICLVGKPALLTANEATVISVVPLDDPGRIAMFASLPSPPESSVIEFTNTSVEEMFDFTDIAS